MPFLSTKDTATGYVTLRFRMPVGAEELRAGPLKLRELLPRDRIGHAVVHKPEDREFESMAQFLLAQSIIRDKFSRRAAIAFVFPGGSLDDVVKQRLTEQGESNNCHIGFFTTDDDARQWLTGWA